MRNGLSASLVAALVLPLYLLVILPVGVVSRATWDPLRLRFRRNRATHFRYQGHAGGTA